MLSESKIAFLDRYYIDKTKKSSEVNGSSMILLKTELLRETEKAVLVRIKGRDHWLPKSQVSIQNDQCLIAVWLMKAKGITI